MCFTEKKGCIEADMKTGNQEERKRKKEERGCKIR